MDMFLADPCSDDPPSADLRVLRGDAATGIGIHAGWLCDLALDDNGTPGSGGFDAFRQSDGQFAGTAGTAEAAAELLRVTL